MTRASIVRRDKDSALPASNTEQKIIDTCFLEEWKTKKKMQLSIFPMPPINTIVVLSVHFAWDS